MSNKTRSTIKGVAVLLVLLAVLMQLGIISIAGLQAYRFWMVVMGFGLVVMVSR